MSVALNESALNESALQEGHVPDVAVIDEATTEYTASKKVRKNRPSLTLVSPLRATTASRGTFIAVVVGILGLGLVAMLVINTSLAQGSFTVMDLKAEQRALVATEEALAQQVARAASPVVLEQRARAMGMVPSPSPAFLRVTDGTVLGKPKPAPGNAAATIAIAAPSAGLNEVSTADTALALGAARPLPQGVQGEDALWSDVAPVPSTVGDNGSPSADPATALVAEPAAEPGLNVDVLLEARPVVGE